MIGVGEKTGNLDAVMNRIAAHYNEEAQNMLSGMTVMIEPVMVGLLSVIIGIILLSIMLPMMGIMSISAEGEETDRLIPAFRR